MAEAQSAAPDKGAASPTAPTENPEAKTNTGAGGMSLGERTEIGGGGTIKELVADPEDATVSRDPARWHKRYISSRLGKDAGSIIGRSPDQIGLWGKGDTYRGSGILVNIDTLEKVRVGDGYKFTGDEVYANSRDLPHALVDGDIAKNLSGDS